MSNPQFTNDGLEIESFNDIYTRLVTGLQTIYGADINTDPDSPDGQRIGILTQLVLDLETFGLQLYNQMDCNLASGEWLNKLIKFAGIFRKPATRSQVDVTVTTSKILTLPANYTVQDTLNQNWILQAETVCGVGANNLTLIADVFGAIAAAAHTVNLPATVVLGVTSVDNAAIALVGRDEETDEDLRIRRASSIANPSFSTVGGLFAKLANLPNVTDVIVYENNNDVLDVTRNMVAHSIWVVIEGGGVTDIVETMVKQRTAGCSTKGAQSGVFNEVVTRPDGSTFTLVHDMTFDRPTNANLYVNLTATRTSSTSPVDIALMQKNIASRAFHIGEACKSSTLYELAYETGDNFILTGLTISTDDITFIAGELTPAYDGKFVISTVNVDITEVIP